MITIDSLTKKYGRTTVVDDVSFVARQGRVTGFLGPNGAGQSTTMRMVVGLTKPTSGSERSTSIRSVVVLPAPLGPRKPVIVPGSQRKLTSETTARPP